MMMAVMVSIATSAFAMSYRQARKQALFLTDKMAYELQLNDEQYAAAYEINLDYLMAVSHSDDVFGTYWARRNADLRYVLAAWQYARYAAAVYFYRPLYWERDAWYFPVYSRYTNRTYYYYPRPHVYYSYRGGYHNGNHRYYSNWNWNRPARQTVIVVKEKNKSYHPFKNMDRRYENNGHAFGKMNHHKQNNGNGSRTFGGHR